uniref:Uncharacterized protein n=1 Tax=Arundo donax TaxID=35708 RepID=A0A0A9DY76_ARUDO
MKSPFAETLVTHSSRLARFTNINSLNFLNALLPPQISIPNFLSIGILFRINCSRFRNWPNGGKCSHPGKSTISMRTRCGRHDTMSIIHPEKVVAM